MNTKKTLLLFFLTFFGTIKFALGQVDSVDYLIRYNSTSCLHECCLIVKNGSAYSALNRLQSNAQFSIVVPTGSTVSIAQNHNPIQSNQNYTGTVPMTWDVGSFVMNPNSIGVDFYGYVPSLSPSSFYNNLNEGDTVRLFSLSISPVADCGSGIRLFENYVDPGSNAPGMGGGDFSQGFSIGGPDPKFSSNANPIYPHKPQINSLTTNCNIGLSINIATLANSCQTPMTYTWSGPDGFASSNQNVHIVSSATYHSGLYKVTVTDAYGCFQTSSIQAYAKPNAGSDQNIACFSSGTATVSAEGNGTWSIGSNSAGTATIASPNNNLSTVSGFSASGNYYLVWSSSNCSDTALIVAGSNCNCNIANNLDIPNNHSYCTISPALNLNGNQVTGSTGTYQWIYRLNNQSYINAPGIFSNEDYQTQSLNPGIHYFRRIYNKTSSPTCSDTSNTIIITVIPSQDAGVDKSVYCIADGTASLTSTTQGLWSLGAISAGTVNFSSISGLNTTLSLFSSAGVYNIVRSSGLCSDTALITVYDLCTCTYANAGPDRSKCAGDTIILSGHCSQGIWSALSTNPSGASLSPSGNGSALVQLNEQAVGIFKFVYATLNEERDTVTYTIHPKPVVSLGEDFGFCEGGESVIITANGGISYVWSTSQTTNSILIAPQTSTTYAVTGTDANGCKNSDFLNVTIHPKPQGAVPSVPPVYENDDLYLYAGSWSNASQFQWQGPNSFISNLPDNMIPNVTMDEAGMYYLTVTSPDQCTSVSSVMVMVMEGVLPVRLVNFSGFYNKELRSNEINWQTQTEVNNDYFILQRSEDNGFTFKAITTIKGAGNSNSIIEYFFNDEDILPGKKYLYKLVQVDYNEKENNSEIIIIRTDGDGLDDIQFYPNPVTENLFVKIAKPLDEVLKIEIYNVNGAMIYNGSIEAGKSGNMLIEDFNGLQIQQGMYIAKINVKQTDKYYKLIVVEK